jgi:hypothetical protein
MAKKEKSNRNTRFSMDTSYLLYGDPSWNYVSDCFRFGSFDNELYLVAAIKRWLLTPEQSELLKQSGYTIEDCLNGRTLDFDKSRLYDAWNEKIGFKVFGSGKT